MLELPLTRAAERRSLYNAANDLHEQFAGIFGIETIEQLLVSSLEEMAAHATVHNQFRVALVERLTRDRLRALAKVQGHIDQDLPAVVFLCVHNAARSQMALGWFTHLAGSRAVAWSGGSQPTATVDETAVAAMAEVGVDISEAFSKPWTDKVLLAADVVVTMSCGDACALFTGKHYEDWDVEDPSGKTIDQIRHIRDDIGRRVIRLLNHRGISASPEPVAGLLSTRPPVRTLRLAKP